MKKLLKAFCMSFSMFCAIPTPFAHIWEDSVRSLMLVVFPFVGTVIGAIWAGVGVLMRHFGCPAIFTAAILTLLPYWLSGGIHLDGFMDCCDAVFSRRPIEKKREILKDSHVGSFAVMSLAMLLLVGFSAFASFDGSKNLWALVLVATASRACSAIGVSTLRPMGHSEYAGNFQQGISKGNIATLALILAACFAIGWFAFGISGVGAVSATVLGYIAFTAYTFKELDGFSGDVTGLGTTMAELCGVIAMMLF